MNSNNLFKYIFAAVVVFLVGYTFFIIVQNKKDVGNESLDQTSKVSNIQTDLRLAIAEMDTINPILSKNRNVQEVAKLIYDPLITLNENYKLEYCLAEEIAKTDDVTYIVKLRKGVIWENRKHFTAEDVVFTMDLIKNINSIYSENLKYVYDLEIIDTATVKIILTEPVQFFEYNLTFPIMSREFYEGEDFATSEKVPIGTGMFRIDDISENLIRLVPNERYWNSERKPMATKINVNLYGSMGEVYSAFKNGELDALSIKRNDVENYVGTLGYHKIEYKSRDYDFISFNTENEILQDPTVRNAISLMIDKNSIVATLGSGYVASNFSLDMGFWLYTKDLTVQPDTEKAKQILAVNGWQYMNNVWQRRLDGRIQRLEFALAVNASNEMRVAVAENIRMQLANEGIPVYIEYLGDGNYQNALENKNYDAIITGIRVGYTPSLNTFFGENNIANYYNEEVAEIMNIVSNTNEDNTLYENYNRLYEIYLEEAPYIGLYRNTDIIICNQNLVSNMTANCFNMYHNIEKWYRQ